MSFTSSKGDSDDDDTSLTIPKHPPPVFLSMLIIPILYNYAEKNDYYT